EGRRNRDRGPSSRAPAPLPADAAPARCLAVDDDRLPGTDRHDQAVHRELRQAARDHAHQRDRAKAGRLGRAGTLSRRRSPYVSEPSGVLREINLAFAICSTHFGWWRSAQSSRTQPRVIALSEWRVVGWISERWRWPSRRKKEVYISQSCTISAFWSRKAWLRSPYQRKKPVTAKRTASAAVTIALIF